MDPRDPAGRAGALVAGAGLLVVAHALARLAGFGLSILVGREGGARALGVWAAVGAAGFVLGGLGSLGLSEWVVYRAAEDRAEGRGLGRRVAGAHAGFLASSALAFVGLILFAPWLAGGPELAGFARAVSLGAAGQAVAAFGLGALRGGGRPVPEALGQLGVAAVIGAGALWATDLDDLALTLIAAGSAPALVAAVSMAVTPGLRPAPRPLAELAGCVREAAPYFAIGVLGIVLGQVELVAALVLPDEEVGRLTAATAIGRAGAGAQWLLATGLLHRMLADHRAGRPGRVLRPALLGLGLGALLAVAGWPALPLVCRLFGLPPEGVLELGAVHLAALPLWLCVLTLLPMAAVVDRRATVLASAGAAVVFVAVGVASAPGLGATGALLGFVAAQLLLLVGCVRALRRARPISATRSA